jgi:hypothetical protein
MPSDGNIFKSFWRRATGLPLSMSKVKQQSPFDRVESYRNRAHMITWVGVGLAAFIALTSGDFSASILADVPTWLNALMVTFIGASGICLGLARVKFETSARVLRKNYPEENSPWKNARPWSSENNGGWRRGAEA